MPQLQAASSAVLLCKTLSPTEFFPSSSAATATAAAATAVRRSEEDKLEEYIKSIANSGARLVVSGGNIGEMAMHFLEKYGLMAVRIPSKFDLRRFCRATGAVALVKLQAPQPDELGFAKQVRFEGAGGVC
jgi:T-complex protein 1 subunit theta